MARQTGSSNPGTKSPIQQGMALSGVFLKGGAKKSNAVVKQARAQTKARRTRQGSAGG